ncbi:MAG: thioredoxin TrxC [Pseudomonadota bacterium]
MESNSLHIACAHCQTTNRVPTARLTQDPICGRCGEALLDGRPIELTDSNFDAVTQHTDLPVLVDFWAPWCGPCVGMAPQFERAAQQLKGRVLFAKVNSDENPLTARRFAIRSIPTLVRLKAGRELARQAGALQAGQIVSFAA